MNNDLSFETAKALKKAGFPQPQPGYGQCWHLEPIGSESECYFIMREPDIYLSAWRCDNFKRIDGTLNLTNAWVTRDFVQDSAFFSPRIDQIGILIRLSLLDAQTMHDLIRKPTAENYAKVWLQQNTRHD